LWTNYFFTSLTRALSLSATDGLKKTTKKKKICVIRVSKLIGVLIFGGIDSFSVFHIEFSFIFILLVVSVFGFSLSHAYC